MLGQEIKANPAFFAGSQQVTLQKMHAMVSMMSDNNHQSRNRE
jgi:hypothetical protein